MPPPTKLTRLCVCLVAAACAPAQQVITTIAGTDWLFPADGRPALQAPLGSNFYTAVTVDPQGNFYVADPDNIMVMKVSQDGVLKVIAGNGIPGISGDGGPGVNASLGAPAGLAFDASGNLYIADFFHVIRKLTPAGIISTIAGTGDAGQSGDGGPATAATISPHGIAVSASGDIYFADDSNHKVRKITPGGIISTVAGTGVADYTGDGGPATSAALNTPTGVAIDATGNLYIADNGNLAIRKVTPAGIITTFAGGGFETDDGVAPLNAAIIPLSVSVSPTGDVYVADFLTYRVRKISGGKITTVAGTGDAGFSGDGGPATAAALNSPSSAAITADGIVYIADSGNSRIRKVTADGRISTVAGNAQFRTGGDGGPAISAVMYLPSGVAADKSGNLYISEQSKNRVRKVSRDGTISLFAGTGEPGRTGDGGPATRATLDGPAGLAADAQGNVYIADQVNSVIRKVTPAGFITNFAGTGRFEFNGDNKPPSAAALFGPAAVAVDATGAVYVSDTYNHRIRKIPAGGNIVTIAGSGQKGFSGDNGPASGASLNGPAGLAVDSALNVYFVDAGNQRVRKITPSGVIATIAGTGTPGFSGDGGPATSAMLKNPASVAVDASGNLYIADQRNHRIRRVTPDGIISTFAGSRFAGFTGDGGPATAATLAGPSDVSLDAAGNVLIADLVNHRVRAVLNGPQNFRISSDSLVFTGPSAGAVTNEQRLALQPSLSGLPFVVEAPGVPWITVTPSSGFMPAVLQIAADPSTQSGGTYSTTLTIASPVALPARQTVNVKFVVSPAAPAKLETKPASLSFTTTQGGQPVAQALTISNSGGGLLSFSASTSSPASWLTLSATSGQATPQKAAAINVTVNPAGLAPGTYSTQVAIATAQGENKTVPVTATVNAAPARIVLSPNGLAFTAVSHGGSVPSQSIVVLNTGSGALAWQATIAAVDGGPPPPWLGVTPATGVSPGSAPGSAFEVKVDPTGLAPGVYYGQINVASPDADNSPQVASVALNVLPADSDPGPVATPTGLTFTASTGAVSPGSQTVFVSNLTDSPITFTSARTTQTGGAWFQYVPATDSIGPGQTRRVLIQPTSANLAPGVYRGALTLAFDNGFSRTLQLLLVVSGPSVSTNTRTNFATAACSPSKLLPLFTSLSSDVKVPAGWPNLLSVRVVDDCGNPMTGGTVVVEFSNSEPTQVLVAGKDGNWGGTWVVRDSATQVTINATAHIPESVLQGTAQVTVGVQENSDPPLIAAGGVVNSASLTGGTVLAPGEVISIFGTRLAQATATSPALPLTSQLAGTVVSLAGRPLPLFFTSSGQVNAMIPYGIPVNARYQLAIARGGSLSAPETVTLAAAHPAILSKDQSGRGQGVILDTNGRYVEPGNPARAGDTVILYASALGAVNPPIPAGAAAPLSPLSTTADPVTVTIGGVSAPVVFAGLSPSFTGLYQLNVTLPAGVPAGPAVPVVVSVAGQLSPPVTMAIQ